jgi:hypothetical protein
VVNYETAAGQASIYEREEEERGVEYFLKTRIVFILLLEVDVPVFPMLLQLLD